jgi:hypothetical protein
VLAIASFVPADIPTTQSAFHQPLTTIGFIPSITHNYRDLNERYFNDGKIATRLISLAVACLLQSTASPAPSQLNGYTPG